MEEIPLFANVNNLAMVDFEDKSQQPEHYEFCIRHQKIS
jgi:hypothetical protein